MKLLLVEKERSDRFAEISATGTWSEGEICSACGQVTQVRIPPLVAQWEPGSDLIGDFTWSSYTAIVQDHVREFLESSGFECRFEDVVYEPTESTRKKIQPTVGFPYEGPRFWWLRATKRIPLNEQASGVELKIDCDVCGQKDYTFRREGIVVDRSSWNGEKLFRIEQFGKSDAKFVSEEGCELLQEQGFSNLTFHEAGVIE